MFKPLPNFHSPILDFYLIIIAIGFIIAWSIALYRKRFVLKDSEKKTEKRTIALLSVATIGLSGLFYMTLHIQGAQNLVQNPHKLALAANLAPDYTKVASAKMVNKAVDEAKDGTVVVVYKFGCTNCQRFFQYAKKNKNLLPSKAKNVYWIPATDKNKSKVKLVDDANGYPTVYLWKKNTKDGQVRMVKYEKPNDTERQQIVNYIKQANR